MSFDDLFVYPIKLIIAFISVGVAFIAFNGFREKWIVVATSIGAVDSASFVTSTYDIFSGLAGYVFIALFIGMMIASFIFATRIPTSIVWAPVSIVVTLLAVWIAAPLSQTHELVLANSYFAQFSTQLQLGHIILAKLPYLLIVIGGILAITTYVKWRDESAMPSGYGG